MSKSEEYFRAGKTLMCLLNAKLRYLSVACESLMEKTFRYLVRSVLVLAITTTGSDICRAVETLESSALRLEVSTNPYSYRVLERSTGEILISQSGTALTVGAELYRVTDASDVIKTVGTLRATLLLGLAGRHSLPAGTLDRAQVSFSFVKPQVLQVIMTYQNGAPDEISEEFSDQGEHYYLRGAANSQAKVIQDADRLRALRIPAGAIWLDRPFGSGDLGWGNMDFDSSFPDPSKMVRDLNARGMNLLLWIANRCSSRLFQEGSAKGYLFPLKWPAADIRRPEIYKWFTDNLNAYVRLGIKGYKIDRGEENEMPDSFQNENAVLFPKLAAEGLSATYGGDYFTFSRNVNDTGRKYTAVWNGDTWSSFSGLQVSIKNGRCAGAMHF